MCVCLCVCVYFFFLFPIYVRIGKRTITLRLYYLQIKALLNFQGKMKEGEPGDRGDQCGEGQAGEDLLSPLGLARRLQRRIRHCLRWLWQNQHPSVLAPTGSPLVPPNPGLWGALPRPLGKWLGKKNSLNFWAQWMEFILRGDEGEKGVHLHFVGNLYRAEGERRERRKIPRRLLRSGALRQRCRL